MPRAILNLTDSDDLRQAQAQWRFGPGFVPGEPNEGLVSQSTDSPARLADYDDSSWEVCQDLTRWLSQGFTFAWYRTKVTFPSSVGGRSIVGARCLFETCIDDYGEVWIDGECDLERGSVQGFTRAPKNIDQHRAPAWRNTHHRSFGGQWPTGGTGRRCVCPLRQPILRVAGVG